MNRGNIWITVGLILLLCLCHTLLTGLYPVRTLLPTINETIDRITDRKRNLHRKNVDRQTTKGGISRVVFGHSGQLLATTKRNVGLKEPTQLELRTFKDGSIVRTLEGPGRFGDYVFSPDDSLIAAGTFNDIYIWRTNNGQLMHKLPTTSLYSYGTSVNFSSDGNKLISRGKKRIFREKKFVSYLEQQIVAWDVTSGQRLYSLDVQDQFVSVSPGGKFFAVGRRGGFVQIYHIDDGTLLRQLSIKGSPQFVSDDKILIDTYGGSGYIVLLYQITSNTTSAHLFGLSSNLPTNGVSSPDGRFLIGGKSGGGEGGGRDGGFFIAAPRFQEPKVITYFLWQMDGPYPLPIKKFFVRTGHSPRLFTPDSKLFLAGGDLFRLPLVHPWLANALVMVAVALVIFFSDRFPPLR